jgi:cytidylate kinase
MPSIIIAIDGFSSTGKSSLAKQLAARLGYTYVDSGAMYRAITLYFLEEGTDLRDPQQVDQALASLRLNFVDNRICINGVCAEPAIREPRISAQVSEVSALPAVRAFAVVQQQRMGEGRGLVMDGRDIGTAVFPDAELKIYLYADERIRAERRFAELQATHADVRFEEVAENLKHRDHLDSTREISPLRIASDAVILDNSALTFEQTLDKAHALALSVIRRSEG